MNELIQTSGISAVEISITPDALTERDGILRDSRAIETISDNFDYEIAGEDMKKIKALINRVEESRKAVKKPIDELAQKIQEAAREYTKPLDAERGRLSELILSFEEAEQRKREEAERIAREKIRLEKEAEEKALRERIEKEHKEGRTGTLIEETNKIQDKTSAKIAEIKQEVANITPPLIKGVRRTTTTKFEIEDEDALRNARPDLFSPDEKKIRAALKITQKIPGLKVWEETKI